MVIREERRMTQEFYMKDEDWTVRISRDSFKLILRLPGVADRLPIRDVQRCLKCIRQMFTPYIYLKFLNDLMDYVGEFTVTNTKRYYKIKPIIKGELDKYE